jgi:hypothetical protein
MLSAGSDSIRSPDTIGFEVTWSRGTSGFCSTVTVMPPTSIARCSSARLTVLVWPASTRTFRVSAGAYPMNWARTVTKPTGTLLRK